MEGSQGPSARAPDGAKAGAEGSAPDAARFPCPKCGADLLYDPAVKGLRCPFCGESRLLEGGGEVLERDLEEALRAAAADRSAATLPAEARRQDCASCGAVLSVPASEKAGRCPYCGSVQVAPEAPGGTRMLPECVLPFAVDRVRAETLFLKWLRSLWFRPNALKHGSALGDMRGVLVPFWTFDARARSSWTAMAGHSYYVKVGKSTVRRVRWVPASGERSDDYDDLLVCASRGLDAGLVAKIEPFELKALVPFRPEYLAGWAAEGYGVDVREAWTGAERRILESQVSRCSRDVPGDTQRDLNVRTTLSGKRYRHALLPVWVAAYRFRGKAFRFLVNGQTGEVQGEAPWSWVKIGLAAAAIAAIIVGVIIFAKG